MSRKAGRKEGGRIRCNHENRASVGRNITTPGLRAGTGRVKTIRAHVRQLPIPPVLLTSAVTEPGPVREQFREWIERVWTEKDAVLAELLARTNEP